MPAGVNTGSKAKDQRAALAGRRLLWVMLLRVGLITALLGATFVLNYGTLSDLKAPSPIFLLGLVAATYAATIIYALWYRTGKKIETLTWIQFGIDSIFWACLAYATGGVASGFTFLFDLWVIVAAVVLGGRAAFVSAAASAFVLLLMSVLMVVQLLEPLSDQLAASQTLQSTLYFLGVNVVSLFVVAGLVSSLVGRLEKAGRGLERERIQRADLAVLHSDIIRSLTVGLVTVGMGGEILSMNPMGLSLLNVAFKDIESRKLSEWIPALKSILKEGEGLDARGLGVCITSDGRKLPIDYIVTQLLNAAGNRRGSIVIFNDLTVVKKLEADLERARKLAALGQLGANLAHEIRNPLSAVYGSFQMLADRPDYNEEERSLSEIVLRELKRMERLVNDMLEYTRPRDPDRRLVDVSKLLEDIVKSFLLSKEAEGRRVDLILAEEEATARLDQGQIKQVIWNLLRNAMQATDENGTIEIILSVMEKELLIEVEDDGPGITEADRTKIFHPFFSTRERGLGLGLAICARIVESHGGNIDIGESTLGGALFRVSLPRQSSTWQLHNSLA